MRRFGRTGSVDFWLTSGEITLADDQLVKQIAVTLWFSYHVS